MWRRTVFPQVRNSPRFKEGDQVRGRHGSASPLEPPQRLEGDSREPPRMRAMAVFAMPADAVLLSPPKLTVRYES